MLNFMKVMSLLMLFSFSSSCGFNALSFLEGEIPEDEKSRMERGEGEVDAKKLRAEAKEELPEEVVTAVNAVEKALFVDKIALKDISPELIENLAAAIPEKVKDVVANGTTEEKEEVISSYSKLIESYANDSDYDQGEFLDVLLKAAGKSKDTNLVLSGECSDDMSIILEVVAGFRRDFCKAGTDGIIEGLSGAEFSALLGSSVYLTEEDDGSYSYSETVSELAEVISAEVQGAVDGDNLNTYLLDFFFPLVYTSCFFVQDDCSFNASEVKEEELKEIWDHFQSSLPLEIHLKDTGLLPDLSFTTASIIDAVEKDAEEIEDAGCKFGDGKKHLCSLNNYLEDIGEKCSEEAAASENDCTAGGE